jgi:hypothetical protein
LISLSTPVSFHWTVPLKVPIKINSRDMEEKKIGKTKPNLDSIISFSSAVETAIIVFRLIIVF